MNIEKLNPWIALVTNIGVLFGIVLLIVEISQNTHALEIQTEDTNVSHWIAANQLVAGSADLAEIVVRGDEGLANLDAAERLRYEQYVFGFLTIREMSFRSIQRGQYDYDNAYGAFVLLEVSKPGTREIYETNKAYFSQEFVAWVDQLLNESD